MGGDTVGGCHLSLRLCAAPGAEGRLRQSRWFSLETASHRLSLPSKVRAAFKHKTKVWSLTSSSGRTATAKPFGSDVVRAGRVLQGGQPPSQSVSPAPAPRSPAPAAPRTPSCWLAPPRIPASPTARSPVRRPPPGSPFLLT